MVARPLWAFIGSAPQSLRHVAFDVSSLGRHLFLFRDERNPYVLK